MPDDKNTQIIVAAIVDVKQDVKELRETTVELSGDVRECGVKLSNVEKQLDKQNGRINAVEDTANEALVAAEHAKSIFWKRGTIIVAGIGAVGGLGAAAIKVWG